TAGAVTPVLGGGRSGGRGQLWLVRSATEAVANVRARRLRHVNREAQARTHGAVVRSLADHAGRRRAVPGLDSLGEFGEGVRHLATRKLTRQRLAELMALERVEHLAINPEQTFEAASARAAGPAGRELVSRGIRVRALGVPPPDGDSIQGDVSLLAQPTCLYREAPEVPMKLIVLDHRIALFPADPRDLDRGYLEVSQATVVRALVQLFDRHWATATDPRRYGMPNINLSGREQELIDLLATGHTDVSAAQQMRISSRSVTNIMRNLMDRLGVENRFQLGLALGSLRVVDLPPLAPATPAAPEEKTS
ncbi:MAG TPA: helix-turn-helix transcriptional regulator, partial [Pilimelia sp.]|nr:helix-turn-helix transcriptional regulator [Pilimelia sp.]